MAREEEKASEGEEEEDASEYEEYTGNSLHQFIKNIWCLNYKYGTDSEEDTGPRLRPIFVSKRDRVTIVEKEKEYEKQVELELEAKRIAEERRKHTLKVSALVFRLFNNDSNTLALRL